MRKLIFKSIRGIMKPFKGKGLSKTFIGKFLYEKVFVPNKPTYIDLPDNELMKGFRLYIYKEKDILSDGILIKRSYEPLQTKVIKDLVKEGDVVVDAGANIGYYTILLSRLVGETGRVYAFEPSKNSIKLLKKNLKFNKCTNVELIPKALSNKEGKISFYINPLDKGNNSIKKAEGSKEVKVMCTKLDNCIPSNKQIALMKMDIEEAEVVALEGAEDTLKRCDKVVIEAPEDREDYSKIYDLLKAAKYKISRINEGNILAEKEKGVYNN